MIKKALLVVKVFYLGYFLYFFFDNLTSYLVNIKDVLYIT